MTNNNSEYESAIVHPPRLIASIDLLDITKNLRHNIAENFLSGFLILDLRNTYLYKELFLKLAAEMRKTEKGEIRALTNILNKYIDTKMQALNKAHKIVVDDTVNKTDEVDKGEGSTPVK